MIVWTQLMRTGWKNETDTALLREPSALNLKI